MGELAIQLLCAAVLAVLFLQSGIDKIVDRRGNLDYLNKHFGKSPLAKQVPLLLIGITVLEMAAGVLSGLGVLQLVFGDTHTLAFWGAVTAGVALVGLFFGQRMAKDYAGAAALVPYFLLTFVAIYFQARR
jgi:hypothetical protein